MPANSQDATQSGSAQIEAAHVAILMGTKDGAAFLAEQLESIANQTHENWSLIVSDDGSTDETRKIVEGFSAAHSQTIVLRDGPRRGVCANFLSLASDPTIAADYFAFSDQDDLWRPDKLRLALNRLATVPAGVPAMYCGRTDLMTSDGHVYGRSPLFAKPPSFQNALVQSLGGGNTMMFNRAAKRLLERAGPLDVVLHDWWTYQLVSAAGGAIYYDREPMVKYRQHPHSLIGSNIGSRARLIRIGLMLGGRFRRWNELNLAALRSLPETIITPANRMTLELFAEARQASIFKRLALLGRSGVYRQTWLGNIGLVVGALLKRI